MPRLTRRSERWAWSAHAELIADDNADAHLSRPVDSAKTLPWAAYVEGWADGQNIIVRLLVDAPDFPGAAGWAMTGPDADGLMAKTPLSMQPASGPLHLVLQGLADARSVRVVRTRQVRAAETLDARVGVGVESQATSGRDTTLLSVPDARSGEVCRERRSRV